MHGAIRAAEAEYERSLFNAWYTARLTRSEEIKPFKYYLDSLKPQGETSIKDILASFQAMEAVGVPLTIKKVEK